MNLIKEKIKKIIPKWLIVLLAIFFILFILIANFAFVFEYTYKNKIYPGIIIGENDFSGLTQEEAREIINKKINLYNKDGIIFQYNGEEKNIFPTEPSFASDFVIQVFSINSEETITKLYNIGRDKNFFQNWKEKIKNIFNNKKINATYQINEELIKENLSEKFKKLEIKPQNAGIQLSFNKEKGGNIEIITTKEKEGKIINYENGIEALKNNLKNLSNKKIVLTSQNVKPEIRKDEIKNIDKKIEEIIQQLPFKLRAKDKEWTIDKEEFILLAGLEKKDEEVLVNFDEKKLSSYLEQNIGSVINISPRDAYFEIKDGIVTNFQPHQEGIELNIKNSITKIKKDFFEEKATSTDLIIKKIESKIKIEDINDLGIKEIIGTGYSNFSGSPPNRIHNINNGAKAVSGTLIKPGEEFSLVNTLGEVNAETGYLPELVIRGNETVPEYGGGLCQVATTIFRGALNAGLEIIERRNHSYRVSYYEPAGTDATVYIPKPDLKFKNNTNNYILIQYRISGNNLYFDFWGTKDGRKVEITKPTIYNIVSPPPTKLIETLDLPAGSKKCTERAHNGADAYFDYKVTYTNGETYEERFSSHYVPWQEVCLIGVEKLSSENSINQATSTEKMINNTEE